MNRKEAFEQLIARLENPNLIKHSLAVEAIMLKLSDVFSEKTEIWGLAGLLHDIDLDIVGSDLSKHGLLGGEILEDLEVDEAIVYAVKAHNDLNGIPRRRKLDKALFCADPMSGLITACALILPSKKLADIDKDFVIKRFNEKGFAKGANREQILTCSEIDLSLEEFIDISLEAMKGISNEIGL